MAQGMNWAGFGQSDIRAPLVGRVGEMRELDKALEAVVGKGESRIVTVIGPTGVGKSRLLHDFLAKLRQVRDLNLRTYRGSARNTQQGFGLISRFLRARFGLVEGMDEEAAKAQVRSQVASVLEDRKVGDVVYFIGQLLDLNFEGSPLTKAVADDAPEASLLRRSVLRSFIEADALRGPMCLIFEDLHEAHEDSLELLRFLLKHLNGPVLAVCLARNELMSRHEDWGQLGGDHHRIVELSPLGELDAASVMQALLAPCGEPPQPLVEAACQLAGGNPLLLEQMVRIFHDTGVLEDEDAMAETPVWLVHLDKLATVRLPLTVDDAVQARVAALAPTERELLEKAAIMGSVFWLGALVVLGRAERKVPELWVASDDSDIRAIKEQLDELTERDYVLKLPDSTFPGDEEYVFKHNLERERIAKLTSPSAAKRHHHSVADWLEHQSNLRAHEEYMAMLGNHRDRAGFPYASGLAYLEAGDIARSRYASSKAAEHYRKGLELLGTQDPRRRMEAQHNFGDVLLQLGKTEDALTSFRDMLAVAYRLNIPGKGGAAHNRIGRLYREIGSLDESGRHLGTALGLFESCADERGVASSLDDIGKLHWLRGDYPRALDQTRLALQMRRRLGDRRSIALSLNNLGLVLQDSGEFKEAIEAFDQALQIRQEIGDLVGVVISLNNLGTVAQDQRDFDKALAIFLQALSVAREIGDRNKIALVLTNIGEVSHQMGKAADAIRYLKQAEELCDELGDKLGLADALRGLGVAYLSQNDILKARDCISRAVDIFASVRSKVHLGSALRTLGEITAAGGWGQEHSQKAQDYLLRSISIFEEIGNDIELSRSLRAYAKFLVNAHDLGDPATLAAEAENLNRRAEAIVSRLQQYTSTSSGHASSE